jgi:hypothetical protein
MVLEKNQLNKCLTTILFSKCSVQNSEQGSDDLYVPDENTANTLHDIFVACDLLFIYGNVKMIAAC